MTKEKLRALFEMYKGEFLSGEKIAEEMNVSRAAIWKAIKNLKEEGYDIESVKKKGYRLNQNSDVLSLVKIEQYLSVPIKLEQIKLYKQIDSTNKQALIEGLEGGEEWTVIAAEEQTQGIAKNNQLFHSPKGKGVYLSILLKPQVVRDEVKEIGKWTTKAVLDALQEVTELNFNTNNQCEVSYQSKKVCGIMIQELLEVQTEYVQQIVIGIGINVYGEDDYFGVKREDNISLYGITNEYYNRSELIGRILNHFHSIYIMMIKGYI